jgi:hypothetical protein
MRQRANFWSRGDIDGLRSLPYPAAAAACLDAITEAAVDKNGELQQPQ